jgi:hypothetical protein
VGTELSEPQALYPSVQVDEGDRQIGAYSFWVEVSEHEVLFGEMSGDGPGAVVLSIYGGVGCAG